MTISLFNVISVDVVLFHLFEFAPTYLQVTVRKRAIRFPMEDNKAQKLPFSTPPPSHSKKSEYALGITWGLPGDYKGTTF